MENSTMRQENPPEFASYAKRMSGETSSFASVAALWREIAAIGGENGYYFLDGLWRVRGFFFELTGSVGVQRARRDPHEVVVGDAIDFWQVATVEPGRRLTLVAEMKRLGSAALDFELLPEDGGRTCVVVTAYFQPTGTLGLVYWQVLALAHAVIFRGLVRAIARRAARREAADRKKVASAQP
jgi:hypothetical protein